MIMFCQLGGETGTEKLVLLLSGSKVIIENETSCRNWIQTRQARITHAVIYLGVLRATMSTKIRPSAVASISTTPEKRTSTGGNAAKYKNTKNS